MVWGGWKPTRKDGLEVWQPGDPSQEELERSRRKPRRQKRASEPKRRAEDERRGGRIDWEPDESEVEPEAHTYEAPAYSYEPRRMESEEPISGRFPEDAHNAERAEREDFSYGDSQEAREGDRQREGRSVFDRFKFGRGKTQTREEAEQKGFLSVDIKNRLREYFGKFVSWAKANPEKALVLGAGAMAYALGGANILAWVLGSALAGYVASMATKRRRTMPVFMGAAAVALMTFTEGFLPQFYIIYTIAETIWRNYKKIPPEVHAGHDEHH